MYSIKDRKQRNRKIPMKGLHMRTSVIESESWSIIFMKGLHDGRNPTPIIYIYIPRKIQ